MKRNFKFPWYMINRRIWNKLTETWIITIHPPLPCSQNSFLLSLIYFHFVIYHEFFPRYWELKRKKLKLSFLTANVKRNSFSDIAVSDFLLIFQWFILTLKTISDSCTYRNVDYYLEFYRQLSCKIVIKKI